MPISVNFSYFATVKIENHGIKILRPTPLLYTDYLTSVIDTTEFQINFLSSLLIIARGVGREIFIPWFSIFTVAK